MSNIENKALKNLAKSEAISALREKEVDVVAPWAWTVRELRELLSHIAELETAVGLRV